MDNEETDDEENQSSKVFAGAIPLGSIFGNIFGGQNQAQEASGTIKKKVKPITIILKKVIKNIINPLFFIFRTS